MKRYFGLAALLACAVCVAPLAFADSKAAPEEKGLCKADEQAVFSCLMSKGEKTASICVSGKNLTYRYGKPEKIELEFPARPAAGADKFKFKRQPSDLNLLRSLSFVNGDVRYVLTHVEYSQRFTPGKDDTADVSVEIKGKRAVHLRCGDEVIVHWKRLEGVLPADPEGFE
jgi:hypothetical protein